LSRAWLDLGLRTMRRHFPDASCRARNAVALAAWYGDRVRKRVGTTHSDAYDDTFWDFHDSGDWTGLARVLLRRFPSASVVDVGCGQGLALDAFREVDPNLRLRASTTRRPPSPELAPDSWMFRRSTSLR
jgi:hypothetical protein